jgi:hypothetical protein
MQREIAREQSERAVSKEVKKEINISLVERMTQRQIIEAMQFAKDQRSSENQKVAFDVFYDVFYYLGTFNENF